MGDRSTTFKGNNTFKFGVDMVHNYDFTNVLNNDPNGYFSYNYIGNYLRRYLQPSQWEND